LYTELPFSFAGAIYLVRSQSCGSIGNGLHRAFFQAATSAMMPQLENNKAPDETFVSMSEQ
jgi:hypothetical protein